MNICLCILNRRIYNDGLVLRCSVFRDLALRVTDGRSRNVGNQPSYVISSKSEDLNYTAVEA